MDPCVVYLENALHSWFFCLHLTIQIREYLFNHFSVYHEEIKDGLKCLPEREIQTYLYYVNSSNLNKFIKNDS